MKFFGKSLKKTEGFTLIELLVVIAIIGVLASVIVASINTARKKGRDARRIRDIQEMRNAIELYISANGHAPDLGTPECSDPNYSDNTSLCIANETPGYTTQWSALESELSPYISRLPKDPCGLSCFDQGNPNLNYNGYFTYNYESPAKVSNMPGGGTNTSYLVGAQNLESKANTSFGFTGGSY
jgi:prepilin-type N-terminal cleavage/methylation domain-containing protein